LTAPRGSCLTSKSTQSLVGSASVQTVFDAGKRSSPIESSGNILKDFGYHLENPKDNSIDIVRHETKVKGLLSPREVRVSKRIGNIPWPGKNREVGVKDLKRVREICRLREEDGVDSDSFYSYSAVVDSFVNRYRAVLRRLAKT
jgi:hypothetical protein